MNTKTLTTDLNKIINNVSTQLNETFVPKLVTVNTAQYYKIEGGYQKVEDTTEYKVTSVKQITDKDLENIQYTSMLKIPYEQKTTWYYSRITDRVYTSNQEFLLAFRIGAENYGDPIAIEGMSPKFSDQTWIIQTRSETNWGLSSELATKLKRAFKLFLNKNLQATRAGALDHVALKVEDGSWKVYRLEMASANTHVGMEVIMNLPVDILGLIPVDVDFERELKQIEDSGLATYSEHSDELTPGIDPKAELIFLSNFDSGSIFKGLLISFAIAMTLDSNIKEADNNVIAPQEIISELRRSLIPVFKPRVVPNGLYPTTPKIQVEFMNATTSKRHNSQAVFNKEGTRGRCCLIRITKNSPTLDMHTRLTICLHFGMLGGSGWIGTICLRDVLVGDILKGLTLWPEGSSLWRAIIEMDDASVTPEATYLGQYVWKFSYAESDKLQTSQVEFTYQPITSVYNSSTFSFGAKEDMHEFTWHNTPYVPLERQMPNSELFTINLVSCYTSPNLRAKLLAGIRGQILCKILELTKADLQDKKSKARLQYVSAALDELCK